ncbi:MAG: hypothetical protein JXN62_00720 [Bacteroidales bacterium]|nr:hypothetical protein [Bacteroidales bacterium]
MLHRTFNYSFNDLKLQAHQIGNILGYKYEETDEIVSQLILEVFNECETLAGIKAEYRIFHDIILDKELKTIQVEGLIFNIGKIIFDHIGNSDAVAFFLCTAGKETDESSKKYIKKGDLLRGYIFDVVGSGIAEAAAGIVQDQLEKEMQADAGNITNRFSPGYCGWDVAEQHKFFQLMQDNSCGIHLTPSAVMHPVKSVSGIIGSGKNVKKLPYTCSLCNLKDCNYRGTIK